MKLLKNNLVVVRALVYVVVLALLFFGCGSHKKTVKDDSDGVGVETVIRDGTSMEKAIVVKSVPAEYEWVRKYYPGSEVQSQALLNKGKKYYDMLEVKEADGNQRKVYFDITSFFGKGF